MAFSLKGKNLLLEEQILSFKITLFLESYRILSREINRKSLKLYPFVKMAENRNEHIPIHGFEMFSKVP